MKKIRIYFYQGVFCFMMTLVMVITAVRVHPHGVNNAFGMLSVVFLFGMVFNYVCFLCEVDKRKD